MAMNLPQGDADEPLRRKAGRQEENRFKKKKKGREGDLGGEKKAAKKMQKSYVFHLVFHNSS